MLKRFGATRKFEDGKIADLPSSSVYQDLEKEKLTVLAVKKQPYINSLISCRGKSLRFREYD